MPRNQILFCLSVLVVLLAGLSTVAAQPTFTQTAAPSEIGPGSVSVLRFDLTNAGGAVADELAFTHNLPANVVVATPAMAFTSCTDGVVTATEGGSSISFSNGRLGGSSTCFVSVNITSATGGDHFMTSGDLTSSAGNSGPSTASLAVDLDRPGLSMSFAPASVPLGDVSTLSFTIDNTANATSTAANLAFTHILDGLVVAEPNNATSSCGGTLTALAGSETISTSGGSVAAGAACAISVDVMTMSVGRNENRSGEMNTMLLVNPFPTVSVGRAVAALDVVRDGEIHLLAEFTEDYAGPGTTTNLHVEMINFHRTLPATDIAFSGDLDLALTGLAASGLPISDLCGTGSLVSGTDSLSFTGGTLAAGTSCSFDVQVALPGAAPFGEYSVSFGRITATIDSASVGGNVSTPKLFVASSVSISHSFLVDPVAPGTSTTLRYTIENNSQTQTASGIFFQDEITTSLPGVSVTLPAAGFCGAGALMFNTASPPGVTLSMSGAEIFAGDSCSFDVIVDLPLTLASGTYEHQTGSVSATIGGVSTLALGDPSTLTVVAAPNLSRSFDAATVQPGALVNLTYHLELSDDFPDAASAINFSDDLEAQLSGLVATTLPLTDVCGAGSSLTGTSNLSLTGASLSPGQQCTIVVPLQVPADAAGGTYLGTTSNVGALIGDLSTQSGPASANLHIAELLFTMDYLDDPVAPGGSATLEFTIENLSAEDATNLSFNENLDDVVNNLSTADGNIVDPCGAGSGLVQVGTTLTLSGGNLLAGATCSFSVIVDVPGATTSDVYSAQTSSLEGNVGTPAVVILPAVASLLVAAPITLTTAFVQESALVGDVIDIEFSLFSSDQTQSVTGLSFTDDLDSALSGLVALGLPLNDICGAGSSISGTSVLTFTGGTVSFAQPCTFTVSAQLPATVPVGSQVENLTSDATGNLGAIPVVATAASATLPLHVFDFGMSYGGTPKPGESVTLTFTIENLQDGGAQDMRFTHDLDTTVTGLVASTLPADGFCGQGSAMTGTSLLVMTGASLEAAQSCGFEVTLTVPLDASPGMYTSTTGALKLSAVDAASPASAVLDVRPFAPLFTQTFTPAIISPTATSLMTLTIDSTANSVQVTGLMMTDTLPDGVTVASDQATTTCTGGALTAALGTQLIELANGTVNSNETCTVEIPVTASQEGRYDNTAELSSFAGLSSGASAVLIVQAAPTFSASFSPDEVLVDESTTFTLEIVNTSTYEITGLAFDSVLPAGLSALSPPTSTCGDMVSLSGSEFVLLDGTVAANSTCTITAELQTTEVGTFEVDLELKMATSETLAATATINVGNRANGGCCSVAGSEPRFPIEMILVPVFFAWNRRRRYRC